jgi:hypothetical protein
MSFPFPRNPTDGQVVSHTTSDGTILTATYYASKNEWKVQRTIKQPTVVTSEQRFEVHPTANGQTITWDATANKWVAQANASTLVGLHDVSHHAAPTLGEVPTWSYTPGHPEQGEFFFKTPNAHIKNWDSVTHFESGTVVYSHGQLWRATRDSSNVEPKVEDGRTQLYLHVPGEPTFGILPTDITSTPPPSGLQPMQFKLGYWLQYTNDHTVSVWKWVLKGADPATHKPIGEWEGRPWTCMIWRSPNPPSSPVPPMTVVVWVRSEPSSTVHPIKGQQDWASLELTSYLSQSADVSASTPANHDVLMYDTTQHKWKNVALQDLANLLKPLLATSP